jgi:acyl carrier protein phosphodiesterase
MMNFLSHYYFEQDTTDVNEIIGVVLPDFVKNAEKTYNLYPSKEAHSFKGDSNQLSLYRGWEKHIKVDAIFHSSEFFSSQTQILKQLLLPILGNSPVKPFFLAHIGLELVLDHLLVINNDVKVELFYNALEASDKVALDQFLKNCGLSDTTPFFRFLNGFISGKYLFSYQKIENISYALNRICMRVWEKPFSPEEVDQITVQLEVYKNLLSTSYLSIFNQIEPQLK